NFRRTEKNPRNFKKLGSDFAQTAIDQPLEEWKSDGQARIYCSCRGLPFVLSQLAEWHVNIDEHLERIFYQLDADSSRFAIGEAEKARTDKEKPKEKDSWYSPNAYHTY